MNLFHYISLSSSFLPPFHLKTIFVLNVVEKLTFSPNVENYLFETFRFGKDHLDTCVRVALENHFEEGSPKLNNIGFPTLSVISL